MRGPESRRVRFWSDRRFLSGEAEMNPATARHGMRHYVRLLFCPPLFAITACAADGIAGPRLAPAPEADAAQVAPNTPYQGCIVPPERAGRETLYIIDGVLHRSLPELAATDIESVEVHTNVSHWHGPEVSDMIIITTRNAGQPRSGGRP
jgi:hypothetical protein